MHTQEQISALHDVFDEMLERQNQNALARFIPPIELSPPTQHPSKSVFLREKKLVEKALRQTEELFHTLIPSEEKSDEDKSVLSALAFYLDGHARSKVTDYAKLDPTDVVAASARLVSVRSSLVGIVRAN